jgi:LPXTG-site transpeptidase (sortase) family protein
MRNFLSNIFTIVGVILCFATIGLFWQRNNPNRLSFNFTNQEIVNMANNQTSESENLGRPVGIKIDSINLSLPIIESKMTNGKWETTSKGVSFLDNSAIPGEIGNSIMYGHNWTSILGGIKDVKPGQKIEILHDSGAVSTYIVETVQEVSPNDAGILSQTDDIRLTLYTCSGFLDSKRLVVTAFYQS